MHKTKEGDSSPPMQNEMRDCGHINDNKYDQENNMNEDDMKGHSEETTSIIE
ncbi:MAG: hypothetical protein GZ086_11905 [Gelidibacter sp.]|nr:hypothetical protein [Gelidibacter sp.]